MFDFLKKNKLVYEIGEPLGVRERALNSIDIK
jgi:hypothetical protein